MTQKRKRSCIPWNEVDVYSHLITDLQCIVLDYVIETFSDIGHLFPDQQARHNSTFFQKWVCRQMQERFSMSIFTPHCAESYLFNDEVKTLVNVFQKACRKGDMKLLSSQHMVDRITAEDVRSIGDYVLWSAAENGRVEVLECLHKTYHLTAEDARSTQNNALRWAA